MKKVNEELLLNDVDALELKLQDVKNIAKAQVDSFAISQEKKAEIFDILVNEYAKDINEKIDALKKYIVEIPDDIPVNAEEKTIV